MAGNKRCRSEETDEGQHQSRSPKRVCLGLGRSVESKAVEGAGEAEERPAATSCPSSTAEPYPSVVKDESCPPKDEDDADYDDDDDDYDDIKSESVSETQASEPELDVVWDWAVEVCRGSPSQDQYERAALILINSTNRDPKGTNVPTPSWYRGRRRAFRVDDETGVVRPRQMMDDLRDRQKERASRSASPEGSVQRDPSVSRSPSIKQEDS